MNKTLSLSFLKKFWKPGLILTIVFLIVLGIEGYLLYYKVYASLATNDEEVIIGNNRIVRLDIKSYNQTLALLDSLKTYVAKTINLDNPFN